jgi:hypothetical protein
MIQNFKIEVVTDPITGEKLAIMIPNTPVNDTQQ